MPQPQKQPYSKKGVSAGLSSALAALLVFYGLGYDVYISIFWGALAGIAMAHIVSWLEIKDEAEPEPVIEADSLEDVARDRRRQGKVYARHYRARRKNPIAYFDLDRLAFWKR
jgi:hypothetical protein